MQDKYVGLFYIPNPEKGIMKFKSVLEFEKQVIEKLVQKETKDYYYKMKKKLMILTVNILIRVTMNNFHYSTELNY